MKIVFSNSRIVDINSPYHNQQVSIAVENGQIVDIGNALKGDEEIDLKGQVVTPGWCDLFANFGEPGHEHREDLESGIQSALFGGFTDVCLIPNTDPVVETKGDVKFITSRSSQGVNLRVLAAVSEGCKGENLTEILDLEAAGATAFTDGINPIWNTELLLKALQYVQKFGGLIINRPKDHHLSQFTHMHEGVASTMLGLKGEPSISEEISIKRDLDILMYAGGRLHITHLSTQKGVELVREAKAQGMLVTADVSIHQLVYIDEDLSAYDTNLKVDPPFRSNDDRVALIEGLKDGTIDAIVSSHQPQDPENKELEFDLATTGICALPTVLVELLKIQEELPLEVAVDRLTKGPRAVLQLDNITIDKGQPASFAVFDLEAKWTFNEQTNPSRSANSPLFNQELTGKCTAVYNQSTYFQN